jgi:hypothetical protein
MCAGQRMSAVEFAFASRQRPGGGPVGRLEGRLAASRLGYRGKPLSNCNPV